MRASVVLFCFQGERRDRCLSSHMSLMLPLVACHPDGVFQALPEGVTGRRFVFWDDSGCVNKHGIKSGHLAAGGM